MKFVAAKWNWLTHNFIMQGNLHMFLLLLIMPWQCYRHHTHCAFIISLFPSFVSVPVFQCDGGTSADTGSPSAIVIFLMYFLWIP